MPSIGIMRNAAKGSTSRTACHLLGNARACVTQKRSHDKSINYRCSLLPLLTVGLTLGLLIRLQWSVAPSSDFVGLRLSKLQGSNGEAADSLQVMRAEGQESQSKTEAELRAKVAELEQKLSETQPGPEPEPVEEKPSSPLSRLYEEVLEDISEELNALTNARLGMTEEGQYVFAKGSNASQGKTAIYRRKYEVMGMALTQQEAFVKALTRATKKAKESKAFEKLIEMTQKGGEGMSKKQVKMEIKAIEQTSVTARLVFQDLIPEATKNPLGDAVAGVVFSAVLVIGALAFCICVFPPVPDVE
eukprot:TRINITY_DN67952_c0_g1_i1.p1 TRINITY_DN67952_c0_g1~~TRINITY_DN67952_c0_g1_i1.p1  ORF type:complete len:303 (+),score=63.15 TRINITY_DN67952_c0_g1_i1:64-972(+)